MMAELPEPLVPPEVDLRDFPFTPVFRARLFGSSFHARTNDAEWRAGVTLWLRSWDQVPAGSLPDEEVDLCRLAELGRDLKAWRRLQGGALRGWIKCSDGRLYHTVVAEGVLEAWERRTSAKRKGIAGASKRWGSANSTGNATAIAGAMPSDSKGSGSRSGREVEETKTGKPAALRADVDPEKQEIWTTGKAMLGKEGASFLGKLVKDYGQKLVLQAIRDCKATQPVGPKEWLVARCQERRGNGAGTANKQEQLETRLQRVAENWQPPADDAPR